MATTAWDGCWHVWAWGTADGSPLWLSPWEQWVVLTLSGSVACLLLVRRQRRQRRAAAEAQQQQQ
jgi:hypothetical protein